MNQVQDHKLLSPQEQVVVERIAQSESPHSQRAQAFLSVNDGATQARAAEEAGLSIGQVKYWLGRFREIRLGIFPDAHLDIIPVEAQEEAEVVVEPAAMVETANTVKVKRKKKKLKIKQKPEKENKKSKKKPDKEKKKSKKKAKMAKKNKKAK